VFILGYIDPGTGSYVLQAILAAVIAVPFILKTQIRKIIAKFKK